MDSSCANAVTHHTTIDTVNLYRHRRGVAQFDSHQEGGFALATR